MTCSACKRTCKVTCKLRVRWPATFFLRGNTLHPSTLQIHKQPGLFATNRAFKDPLTRSCAPSSRYLLPAMICRFAYVPRACLFWAAIWNKEGVERGRKTNAKATEPRSKKISGPPAIVLVLHVLGVQGVLARVEGILQASGDTYKEP